MDAQLAQLRDLVLDLATEANALARFLLMSKATTIIDALTEPDNAAELPLTEADVTGCPLCGSCLCTGACDDDDSGDLMPEDAFDAEVGLRNLEEAPDEGCPGCTDTEKCGYHETGDPSDSDEADTCDICQ